MRARVEKVDVLGWNSSQPLIIQLWINPELDNEWLTDVERLTSFIKDREKIVGRVKGSELPYVQGNQSSEEALVVREKVPSRNERL